MVEASSSGPELGQAACLVTGASRGFGRSMVRLVVACLAPGLLLLLAVCSVGVLGELEGELRAAYRELRVQARDAADALRHHHDSARLQRLLLINNAGERVRATGRWERTRGGGRRGSHLPACERRQPGIRREAPPPGLAGLRTCPLPLASSLPRGWGSELGVASPDPWLLLLEGSPRDVPGGKW
ncbi:hypothetical protein JRQ81_014092 [Phrynocephalus forsythii]|uniref:Uncharacterized protein n=1 Tax=Phrynocephalus forsythii TaxID=171643 RepID=A0A9Q0XWN3_9SAUR|nr:hypothetical protein JRQ81_014092 [Phrynocephalus forsythii]